MSLSGSLATAVAGLTSQSRALGHISDNVANSQTTGYKRVETRFNTLVTNSSSSLHSPGGVRATPFRMTDVQGTVISSAQVTNLAMLGTGFFAASKIDGVANGLPTFEQDPFYTRAGDFSIDKEGYLVNTGGYYLNAWSVDDQNNSRVADRTSLQPMRVSQLRDAPSATTRVEYGANLPANITTAQDAEINPVTDPDRGVSVNGDSIDLSATQVTVYDAIGKGHTLDVQWSKPTTRTTDALGISTTEIGELQDNAGTPFVNKNIWYATLNGNDFSFAPEHINSTQTLTSVNETRYKFEFYDTNDAANNITAGGIREITEMQNFAAQSLLETAAAPVSFDGTFKNVGLGVSLDTVASTNAGIANGANHTNAVTGEPQFMIESYNTTSGEFTARISQITPVAGNTVDNYSDKLYSGFVPLNSAGEVDGPVTLTHTQTETGTLAHTSGAKTATVTTAATSTTDVFTLNPPVGLPSGDLTDVIQTMINANLGEATANNIRDAVAISAGTVSSLGANDALTVRAGHTVTTTPGSTGDEGTVSFDINGLQVGQTLSFLHTDAANVQTTVTITVPGNSATGVVNTVDLITAINNNANLAGAAVATPDGTARQVLTVSTAANNQNVTMNGLPTPEAFANNNFEVTSYNDVSGEMTVTAGGRNYTAVVNQGQVGPNTGGAGFVRLVDSADANLPFNEQRSIYVEFQGAVGATAYTANRPNNIIPASSGIPVTSYGVLLESHVRPGSYSGAGASIADGVNPLEIRGTTNPENFLPGQFNVDSIDQEGRVTVTIGSETYSGVLPLNANGEIRFAVGPPLTVEPVNLTSSDGTHSFQLTFDDPWDINGRMLTTGTNTALAAELSANIVLADPGSNLTTDVLPDEARQAITVNFGSYGQADLVTSYAGEEIDFLRTNQDGVPPGSFRDLTIDELGYVTLNYDNGRRRTFFQIPVAQFDNPNALNAEQGNAFSATFESGEAALTGPGASGSGTILSSSVERSNVDIAEEFSKLIITQRTYSANSRVVTASDTLLNETVNLIR